MLSIPSYAAGPRSPAIREEVEAHVRELILSGQAQPGELLRLGPIAEQVGASATPVREALILLARDGWLAEERHVGFRVAPLVRQDIADGFFVQAYVLGEIAARAAVRIDAAALQSVEELDRAIQQLDPASGSLEMRNYELHQLIVSAADSPGLVTYLDATLRVGPRRFWGVIDGWAEHNRTGHRPIVEALAAADPDAARTAAVAHCDSARDLLLAHLDASGAWT